MFYRCSGSLKNNNFFHETKNESQLPLADQLSKISHVQLHSIISQLFENLTNNHGLDLRKRLFGNQHILFINYLL